MMPETDVILESLKDFQRRTVDHVFRRLWLDQDQEKRFLVADEVGLGKTMVAKGVIAKTVEHLRDSGKRIDIVYICSNGQIARQNLRRLNIVGAREYPHADRLTLLPNVISELRDEEINFVSFTPGTSLQLGSSGGRYQERILLYWMLARCWGDRVTGSVRWRKFFEGGMDRERFRERLKRFDWRGLDDELCESFGASVDSSVGPAGGPLPIELEGCAERFTYLRGRPNSSLNQRRNQLIGTLRQLIAHAAVQHLEPDLVILDEFQRFKDVIDPDNVDDSAELARAIFDHEDAKVLLLSATPYKMFTLPDEPEGDDHYTDFIRTVAFLAGDERAAVVADQLRVMRESLLVGGESEAAHHAHDVVQQELRRVISRTERLSSTKNRDGMLVERKLPDVEVAAGDLRSWLTFDSVARQIDRQDVFEYWRSTPYPLNLMERNGYSVRRKFQAAVERSDPTTASLLRTGRGLLPWEDIKSYRRVDPGNAKLRGLFHDVLDRGAWRLAWLPPALPYYSLDDACADPQLAHFTKRLIFSAWAVVPKSIALMVSYEAERRSVEAAGLAERAYDDRPLTAPLQFRMDGDRPANMPALAILYPSLVLARVGDPLEVARTLGKIMPIDRRQLTRTVRQRVSTLLSQLPMQSPRRGPVDQRWYAAAPFLLDQLLATDENQPVLDMMESWGIADSDDQHSALWEHLTRAVGLADVQLGRRPRDLADVLTLMAVAGPGVTALRALSRVCGGAAMLSDADLREYAFEIASGLRSLFNKPEIAAIVRSGDDPYWRAVLRHSLTGGLQGVLDEYVHVLVESEGLQNADRYQRADVIAGQIAEALEVRTTQNLVDQIRVVGGKIKLDPRRINSHFAARYGRAQSDDQTATRESTIRTAFNSPFRPFVLASTSVGQEGLDFHTYSHAIVHWNLPGNPVDLEQREGRVHRYKGHAVRKNVAAVYGTAALSDADDPWSAVFDAAVADRDPADSDLKPFWIFAPKGGAAIERYVPALPLSRETVQYARLQRTVGAYRMVIGQPRQDDLLRYVGDSQQDYSWMGIDLSPPIRN